jgi:excisionase family DNA binding protein
MSEIYFDGTVVSPDAVRRELAPVCPPWAVDLFVETAEPADFAGEEIVSRSGKRYRVSPAGNRYLIKEGKKADGGGGDETPSVAPAAPSKPATEPRRIFTTGQVAKLVGVRPASVNKWFDRGVLKGYRIPGSQERRVPREQLDAFVRDQGLAESLEALESKHGIQQKADAAYKEAEVQRAKEPIKPKKDTTQPNLTDPANAPPFSRDIDSVKPVTRTTQGLISMLTPTRKNHASPKFVQLAKGRGWFTDGRALFKIPDQEMPAIQAGLASQDYGLTPMVDIDQVMKGADRNTAPAKIVGVRPPFGSTTDPVYHLETADKRHAVVNASLMKTLLKRHPGAEVLVRDHDSPVVFKKDGMIIGLIMPTGRVSPSYDGPTNFSQQTFWGGDVGTIYFDGEEVSLETAVTSMIEANCPWTAVFAYIDTAEFGRSRGTEGWEPHTTKTGRVIERKKLPSGRWSERKPGDEGKDDERAADAGSMIAKQVTAYKQMAKGHRDKNTSRYSDFDEGKDHASHISDYAVGLTPNQAKKTWENVQKHLKIDGKAIGKVTDARSLKKALAEVPAHVEKHDHLADIAASIHRKGVRNSYHYASAVSAGGTASGSPKAKEHQGKVVENMRRLSRLISSSRIKNGEVNDLWEHFKKNHGDFIQAALKGKAKKGGMRAAMQKNLAKPIHDKETLDVRLRALMSLHAENHAPKGK